MKRVICSVVLAIALLTTSCCTVRVPIESAPTPTLSFRSHVLVAVVSPDDTGTLRERGHGCGVIIRDDGTRVHVLTAYHVVDEAPPGGSFAIQLEPKGSFIRGVTIDHRIEDLDAAIISFPSIPGSPLPVVRISQSDPGVEDIIWTVGSPSDVWRQVLHRVVSAQCNVHTTCRACPIPNQICFLLDGPVYRGHSGGPVFNREGELVGIVTSIRYMDGHPASGILISISTLRPLLERVLGGE